MFHIDISFKISQEEITASWTVGSYDKSVQILCQHPPKTAKPSKLRLDSLYSLDAIKVWPSLWAS